MIPLEHIEANQEKLRALHEQLGKGIVVRDVLLWAVENQQNIEGTALQALVKICEQHRAQA